MVLVCLFPLAPFSVKIATVYFCYALLTIIFSMILVRLLVFLTVWLAAGRHIWIFPNLLRDDLGVIETFSVLISIDKDEKGKPVPRTTLKYRAAVALFLAGAGAALWKYDTSTIAVQSIHSMHDSVLEFIDSGRKRDMLAGAAMPAGATGLGAFGARKGSDFMRQAQEAAAKAAERAAAAASGAEL